MSTPSLASSVRVPPAGTYQIVGSESAVTSTTKNFFGLAKVRGTFTLRDGEFTIGEPLARSSATATIDADSFSSGNAKRDTDIRSAMFLGAAEYRDITFASSGLTVTDGRIPVLAGTLTIKGIPRPVEVSIESCEMTGDKVRVRARTEIDRYEFGVSARKGLVGQHIGIELDVTAARA